MRAIVLFALFSFLLPASAYAGDLNVTVEGVESAQGSVLGALYADESTFLTPASALGRFKLKATVGDVHFVFHNLAPGKYALSVFHDANDNGKLDRNDLGIPIEGYGFSNDALGSGGPPKFAQAAFEFDGTTKTVTLGLNY